MGREHCSIRWTEHGADESKQLSADRRETGEQQKRQGMQCLAVTTGFSVTVQISKPVSKNGEGHRSIHWTEHGVDESNQLSEVRQTIKHAES